MNLSDSSTSESVDLQMGGSKRDA